MLLSDLLGAWPVLAGTSEFGAMIGLMIGPTIWTLPSPLALGGEIFLGSDRVLWGTDSGMTTVLMRWMPLERGLSTQAWCGQEWLQLMGMDVTVEVGG